MSDVSPGVYFAWDIAAWEALDARHEFIAPVHLFMGICSPDKAQGWAQERQSSLSDQEISTLRAEVEVLASLFGAFGVDPVFLRRELRRRVGQGSYAGAARSQISRSPTSKAAFARADELAQKFSFVWVVHLLAALLEPESGPAITLLKECGVNVSDLRSAALEAVAAALEAVAAPPSVLERFGTDLTRLARSGKIRECIGRRAEMLSMARTLARDTKNNPLLIGDAGVGKTAIVHGLAWRITQDKNLHGKRIIEIRAGDLVAGTRYRGDFEDRVLAIVDEAAADPNVILFIDEIHTLLGAGAAGGALDAANMLKPALARGELRCIGATTAQEYRKYIEKDAALERRFDPLWVEEPPQHEVLLMLEEAYRSRFERRHRVSIGHGALQAAVTLSARHLPDRRLPDKAIDVLEQACVLAALPVITEIPGQPLAPVTYETVAKVVAERAGIPMPPMPGISQSDEWSESLRAMPENLKARVIGQDEACDAVASVVQRRIIMKRAGRPVGALLFLGPTGVGKTELAKATAAALAPLFGSEKLVRLDMSEFMEKHNVARLIGSPPGYIGSDEEGQLTGALRRTPSCVVLLDEIEKAHPDVFNLFLQVFDDGRLTDAQGRTVSAENALFICTSNAVRTAQPERKIGLPRPESRLEQDKARQEWLFAQLCQTFRPEFINRFDEIVVFKALGPPEMQKIARLRLDDVARRLRQNHNMALRVSDAALTVIGEAGYNRNFGAREMGRTVERLVEDPIAGKVLRGEVRNGNTVTLDAAQGQLQWEVDEGDTV